MTTIMSSAANAENGSHTVAGAEGVTIKYTVTGASKIGLLFVHGWMCDRSYWREQVAAFSEDYRVVTVDLGGHGESGNNRDNWSMASFGKDVAAVANTLDVDHLVLIGHSLGGPAVLDAASRIGDRLSGIVGVDTLRTPMAEPMSAEDAAVAFAVSPEEFPGRTEAFVRKSFFIDESPPEMIDEIAKNMASGNPTVAAGAGASYVTFNIREALSVLQDTPLTLINATTPPTDEIALKTVYPNSTLIEIPDAGHFVMLEKPTDFNSALNKSLQQLLETK